MDGMGIRSSHLLPMCFCISLATKGHFELIEVLGGKCHFKKLPGDEKTTHPIARWIGSSTTWGCQPTWGWWFQSCAILKWDCICSLDMFGFLLFFRKLGYKDVVLAGHGKWPPFWDCYMPHCSSTCRHLDISSWLKPWCVCMLGWFSATTGGLVYQEQRPGVLFWKSNTKNTMSSRCPCKYMISRTVDLVFKLPTHIATSSSR